MGTTGLSLPVTGSFVPLLSKCGSSHCLLRPLRSRGGMGGEGDGGVSGHWLFFSSRSLTACQPLPPRTPSPVRSPPASPLVLGPPAGGSIPYGFGKCYAQSPRFLPRHEPSSRAVLPSAHRAVAFVPVLPPSSGACDASRAARLGHQTWERPSAPSTTRVFSC